MNTSLSAHGLHHTYRRRGVFAGRGQPPVTALDNVSLALAPGEAVGLVGRSGSGKSTLLRSLLALARPDAGWISLAGKRVIPGSASALRWYRKEVQYVPQHPAGSLDPRMSVVQLLTEPLRQLRIPGAHRALIRQALDRVELPAEVMVRKPGELSGGQNQRVCLARALVVSPRFLLADEPVSGLDLPLRDSMVHLLHKVVSEDGLGLLFVSHDLPTVGQLCARLVVLSGGSVVEEGATADLLARPLHSVTQELVASIPGFAVAPR